MTDYENEDENKDQDENEDTKSIISTISITEYRPEYKFLKTSTELEIENIKKILSSIPPKNYKRTSRKNLTEQEKKLRALESNRVYLSRKTNLARLRELTEENDTYETILRDDDLKQINELITKKKELANYVNNELQEENKTLENDLLDVSEDNEKLKTIIDHYKKSLQQLSNMNKTLKQENDLLRLNENTAKHLEQDNKPIYNNYNNYNNNTIPSAIFKPQPRNNYLETFK
jgi:DNA repair ATPase RecN